MYCRPFVLSVLSLFLTVLSFSASAAIPNSSLVGSTSGSFAVGPDGSANYDIPIKLPPNVAGVQPSLSLSYSSNGGNGLLGKGWQLSGLSAISRCPTSIERDGYIDVVDFDDNDKYCLDGQRLVEISTDTYRTEIDNFAQIAGDESGFTVTTSAGLIMEYGNTPNSQILAQGRSDVLTWALSEVRDSYGNNYAFQYENEGYTNGEFRPQLILIGNSNTTLSHVAFGYEPREDVMSGYISGSKYQTSQRLISVKTFEKSAGLVKQYLMEYDYDGATNFSQLGSIKECSISTDQCLPPLIFGWSNSVEGFEETAVNDGVNNTGWQTKPKVADVNGDGKSDLIVARYGTWQLLLGGESWSDGYIDTGVANSSYSYAKVIKYNDDELDDLLVPLAGKWKVLISTGNGFEPLLDTGIPNTGYQTNPHVIDVNGDGRSDLVLAYNGVWHVRLMTDNGFGPDITTNISNAEWSRTYPINFDGDGQMDLIFARAYKWQVMRSTGEGFELVNTQESNTGWNTRPHVLDVNGDGLDDLLLAYTGKWFVRFNTGGGFSAPVDTGESNLCWDTAPFVYDYNADGMSDLLIPCNNVWKALVSQGDTMEMVPTTISNVGWNYSPQIMDLNGNGLQDLVLAYSNVWNTRLHKGRPPGLLTSIELGDNSKHVIDYEPLSNSSIYQKDSSETSYPEIQVQPASYAVSQVTQPDGVGGTNAVSYSYKGLRYDRYAKRSLGFSETSIENHKKGVKSTTQFRQDYPFIGMASSIVNEYISTKYSPLSETSIYYSKLDTNAALNIVFPYTSQSIEKSYLYRDEFYYDGAPWAAGSKTVTTDSGYDANGQLTNRTVTTTGDGSSYLISKNNEYAYGYSNRRQGEVSRATVTTTSGASPAKTRVTEFEYDWAKERLAKEIIEPDSADASVSRVANYSYDDFGNRVSTAICDGNYINSCTASAPGARHSTIDFDTDGLFAVTTTNSLGQSIQTTNDARFGVVDSTTDINNLSASSTYDSLGRKLTSTNALGITATINREWCDFSCPTIGGNQAYSKVTKLAPGAPSSISYYDQFNRVIRKQIEGFGEDGGAVELIFVDTEYDSFGRVKRTSEPYFGNTAAQIYWNTPTYDFLGRKIKVNSPNQDGSYDDTSEIQYQGYLTIAKDALGRTTLTTKNALGKVIQVSDKRQKLTRYEYDSLGNLVKTIDSDGNEVSLTYDLRGRKIEMNDPDMGIWKYKYNTFDQLVEQTDAKNQVTTMVYDSAGRMTDRTDLAGTSNAATSTWIYDSAIGKSKGKLAKKTAANGDYTLYSYNSSYGQLINTEQEIAGETFVVKNDYDSLGRAVELTYPSTTAYSTGLKVLRAYNTRGFLERVYKSDNSVTYWQAEVMSPRGQFEAATFGNGVQDLNSYSYANGWLLGSQSYKGASDLRDVAYSFDGVGNIESRLDVLQSSMLESFTYDELDRLTGSSISGGPSGVSHSSKSYGYDDLGNITSKSDVGSYSYVGCGGRPHAVCSAGGTNYSYDANGSMLSGVNGGTVTQVGYTSFNKSNYMQKGNYAVTFNYDADRRRNYKSRIQSGSLNLQTYYVGINGSGAKVFEQEVSSATGTKDIHYIYGAGGQAVATHITEGAAKKTEYFHRDHLGSVALVTNDAGLQVSAVSFDAWGARRNENWSDNSTGAGLESITGNIGFTGQETIEEIGLIHMNGRIYDPRLGKFLSADPLIQAPYNSQSYNRYSYVMNNPLSLIDPSGYSWLSKKWKKIGGFKGVFKAVARIILLGPNVAPLAYSKPVKNYVRSHKWAQQTISVGASVADKLICAGACSATASVYLADINGVTLEKFATSVAISMASSHMFGSILGGGVSSKLQGGKFIDGVTNAAITSAAVYGAQYGASTLSPELYRGSGNAIGEQIKGYTQELDQIKSHPEVKALITDIGRDVKTIFTVGGKTTYDAKLGAIFINIDDIGYSEYPVIGGGVFKYSLARLYVHELFHSTQGLDTFRGQLRMRFGRLGIETEAVNFTNPIMSRYYAEPARDASQYFTFKTR